MFCTNCGKEIKQGVRFCDACGTLIAPESSENELKMQSATIVKSKKIKRIVLNVLMAIGSLFATLAIALFLVSKPNRMQAQLVKEIVGESLSGMGVEDVSIDSVELGDLEDVEGEEVGWVVRISGGGLGKVYHRTAVVALEHKNHVSVLKFIVETKVERNGGGDSSKSVMCKVDNEEIYESSIRQALAEIGIQRETVSQCNLGVGEATDQGLEKDDMAAARYRKAAEQGDAVAQFNLGVCYDNGRGVEEDAQEAAKWYRKAAEQGDPDAQFNLGVCYVNGRGVEEDAKEAVKWYRRAAEQGNSNAQFNLGVCYEHGLGVEEDANESAKWYQKSAEQGNAVAQLNLGMCNLGGLGVEQDAAEAVKWFRKAADQGNADAQFLLGGCYEHGLGVGENAKQALKWYKEAAEQGNVKAMKKFKEVSDWLSPFDRSGEVRK